MTHTCPKHNKPLRRNSRGWFCSAKDSSTASGWCEYRPDPSASVAPGPQNGPSETSAPQAAQKTFKTPKGTELPLLELQGKPYLQVAHRLVWFREEHPLWTIETEQLTVDQERAIFLARIKDEGGRLIATATKHETKAGFQDFIEKAETGAVGRALAMCGYGTQFAPELEEGDRLADSPTTPAKFQKKGGRKPTKKEQEFLDTMPDDPTRPEPKSPAGKKILTAMNGKSVPADQAFPQESLLPEDQEALDRAGL